MNAHQVVKILKADGWEFKEQKGSHQQFIHPQKKGKVTLAVHGNKDIPKGTLAAIFRQAGIKKV